MSSVLATIDQPGPSARSIRASPEAKDDRTRPGRCRVHVGASLREDALDAAERCAPAVVGLFVLAGLVALCVLLRRRPAVLTGELLVVDLLTPRRPLEGDLVGAQTSLSRAPGGRVRRGKGHLVRDVGRRIVRGGHTGRRHGHGERPPGQRRDHRALVRRQVVLHAAVPGRDGDSHQRHVVDDNRPPRPVTVLAEHQAVPVGERCETESRARLRVVVAQHAGELRRRQEHRRQHIQCVVVPGGDGLIVRPGHPCLPIATSVGAP